LPPLAAGGCSLFRSTVSRISHIERTVVLDQTRCEPIKNEDLGLVKMY
jgi:hypothetical protein